MDKIKEKSEEYIVKSPSLQPKLPKRFNQSRTLIITIVIAAILIIGVGGYLVTIRRNQTLLKGQNPTFEVHDKENQPNAKINELTWSQGPYKVFYRNNNGIFSQNTDGRNKKLIYKQDPNSFTLDDFYLINSTKKVLALSWRKAVLMNEDGSGKENVLQVSDSQQIYKTRLSPDGQKAIFLVLKTTNTNDIGTSTEEIYLVNLSTKNVEKIQTLQEELKYGRIENIFWYKNNRQIFLITTTPIGANIHTSYIQYSIYDILSKSVKLLYKRQLFTLNRENVKPISNIVDVTQLVTPEPVYGDSSDADGAENSSNISPDKTKIISLHNGNIAVNENEIMHWYNYHLKLNSGYGWPKWLPDNNHFVVVGQPSLFEEVDIRVIEVNTKKVARLDSAYSVKWFGESFDIPGRLDFLLNSSNVL